MTLESDALVAHYQNEIRSIFAGKPWIVATGVLVQSVHLAKKLKHLGVEKVMAIGTSRGTGDLDKPEDKIETINLDVEHNPDMMQAIRSEESLLANLPQWVCQKIDDLDPQNQAFVIGNIFSGNPSIGNRPTLGFRPLSWQKLENKMIVDAIWDEIGIERAPSRIVDVQIHSVEQLVEIAQQLDWGMGTVWVGDNKIGWHGGATCVRWVRTPTQAKEAHIFLSKTCDKIRIMPFMDGIPCSIHGWVFPEKTIALRPCEMLVYRKEEDAKFVYSGAATNWKPSESTRKTMRNAAIKLGDYLRETVGYRGSFTIDGVATKDGFRPTELNPRFGGALNRMASSLPELPLYFLHLCTAHGLELDYQPQKLQDLIVHAAESNPIVKGMYMLEGAYDLKPRTLHILPQPHNSWRIAQEDEGNTCILRLGPAAAGSILFATVDPIHLPNGTSAAAILSSAFAFANQLWNLGIPKLMAAPDLER